MRSILRCPKHQISFKGNECCPKCYPDANNHPKINIERIHIMKCPHCGFNDGRGEKSYYKIKAKGTRVVNIPPETQSVDIFGCPSCLKLFIKVDGQGEAICQSMQQEQA
jgi:hypothetical protein